MIKRSHTKVRLACGAGCEVELRLKPVAQLELALDGQPALVWNGGKQFMFEHQREKQVGAAHGRRCGRWPSKSTLEGVVDAAGRCRLGPRPGVAGLSAARSRGEPPTCAAADRERLIVPPSGPQLHSGFCGDLLPMLQPPRPALCPLPQEGDPEGWWAENFKSHHDSKPKGPTAVSFDIQFPGSRHLYGIPERATDLALRPTRGPEGPLSGASGALLQPAALTSPPDSGAGRWGTVAAARYGLVGCHATKPTPLLPPNVSCAQPCCVLTPNLCRAVPPVQPGRV